MKLKKKLLSKRIAAMLCSAMLVFAVPFTAMAAEPDDADPAGDATVEETVTEGTDDPALTDPVPDDPDPAPTEEDETTEAQDETTAAEPAVGDAIEVGNYAYVITGANTVTITGFAEGSSVSKVVVKKKITYGEKTYKVTAIEKMAFLGETGIKTVVIRKNVTDIGRKAFCKCSNLTKVNIRSGAEIIRKKAFKDCTKLATVNIKSTSLTTIKANAFKNINAKAVINVQNKKMKTLLKEAVPSYVTVNRV